MHRSHIVSAGCQLPNAALTGVVCLAISELLILESPAALTLSNPLRTVSASNNRGSSSFDQAAGFDDMDTSARVDWEEIWGPPANGIGAYHSEASQTSTVSASEIRASGWVTGTGSFEFWGNETLEQHSISYFEINFTMDEPSMVSLTGQLRLFADTGGTNHDLPEVWVILTGQHGPLFSERLDSLSGSMTRQINETFGSLEAGDYNLVAYAKTDGRYVPEGFGGYGHASYDITLIPEPAPMALGTFGAMMALIRRRRRN